MHMKCLRSNFYDDLEFTVSETKGVLQVTRQQTLCGLSMNCSQGFTDLKVHLP